jgi:hypothetical protein
VEYKVDYEEQQRRQEKAKQMKILQMRNNLGQSGRLNESQDRFLMDNTAIVNDDSANDLSHL